jgi:uncharacterized membrane protein
MMTFRLPLLTACLLLAACSGHGEHDPAAQAPGDADDHDPFAQVAAGEVVHITGTEPFWGGVIEPEGAGWRLVWSTPELPDGVTVPVDRFAGRGGLSYSGTLQGARLDMALSPARCSDGMSDRTYPYGVTVQLGDQTLSGCGWTDSEPYTGGE